jgi:formamidopyrimidine-DNA glycosylase
VPELSDVDGFRRYLTRFAVGRRVESVAVPDRALLRNTTAQALGRAASGERFATPDRHGKWLIAPIGASELLFHFGMTGLLVWSGDRGGRHRHDRIVFRLNGGELRYRNQRRLGGVWLIRAGARRDSVIGALGPDALDLDLRTLRDRLDGRRGEIKSALMDQRLIAGLGNLLTDEILWRARIHPRATVARLGRRRTTRLHAAIAGVLREANPHGRVPARPGWLTEVRNRADAACPRCQTGLRRAPVAGRTTRWCPRCQRR